MQVVCVDTYDDLSDRAAGHVWSALNAKPNLVVGIATGNSPTGLYARLARDAQAHPGRWSLAQLIQLDEWVGLGDSSSSCFAYMRQHVASPLGIPADRVASFDCPDLVAAEASAQAMQAVCNAIGPIDVLILGLGVNGHLGFIEPRSASDAWAPDPCFVTPLHATSQSHQMVAHLSAGSTAPTHGVTLGLSALKSARHILLLTTGRNKDAALAGLLQRAAAPSPTIPGSVLWGHAGATCIVDRSAFAQDTLATLGLI